MPLIFNVTLRLNVRADITVALLLVVAGAGAGGVKDSLVLKGLQPVVLQVAAALDQPAGRQWKQIPMGCTESTWTSTGRAIAVL